MGGFSAIVRRSFSRCLRYLILVLAASPLAARKPTTARISIGTTISGMMMSSILVWMLTLPKNRGRFLGMGDTCCYILILLLHGCLVLLYRPVLRCHPGLIQGENRADIRHKLHCLVHRIELNGVVQEEEICLLVGVPFHLADQRPLVLAVHGTKDLLI